MAPNVNLCFYLSPGNFCNIHHCHSIPTLAYSTIPTFHMNDDSWSFATTISSSQIPHPGTHVIAQKNRHFLTRYQVKYLCGISEDVHAYTILKKTSYK